MWVGADDDSWLNLPLLQTYLAQYDETLPFGIGWMWDREFNETINFFSGGSGMFFSQVGHVFERAIAHKPCLNQINAFVCYEPQCMPGRIAEEFEAAGPAPRVLVHWLGRLKTRTAARTSSMGSD